MKGVRAHAGERTPGGSARGPGRIRGAPVRGAVMFRSTLGAGLVIGAVLIPGTSGALNPLAMQNG